MAASVVGVLSEREEKQLNKLRERLFESNWDSAEFKASLRDLVSYTYTVLMVYRYVHGTCELDRCLAAG